MISYPVYKIVHFVGIAFILLGLGAVLGGFATGAKVPVRVRLAAFLTHGIGMLFALIGGFGMAARLGYGQSGLPSWIYGKVTVWFLLGLGISLAKRKANWALSLIILFAALVGIAAYLAIYKPGMATAQAAL